MNAMNAMQRLEAADRVYQRAKRRAEHDANADRATVLFRRLFLAQAERELDAAVVAAEHTLHRIMHASA